jgi:hypothetical protein
MYWHLVKQSMLSHLSQIPVENFNSFMGPAPYEAAGEGKIGLGDGGKVLVCHRSLPSLILNWIGGEFGGRQPENWNLMEKTSALRKNRFMLAGMAN